MSNRTHHPFSTRLLVRLALLAALSAVLKRLQFPIANDFLRISFENTPILLAGYLFGTAAGGIVGLCADLLGCLLCGYSLNPIILLGAGLIGGIAGLFGRRGCLTRPRLWLSISAAHLLGSLCVKSLGIYLYFATPLATLALRVPTYLLTACLECLILSLLLKNKALYTLLEEV